MFCIAGQRSSTSQGGTGSAQSLMAQPVQYRSVDPSVRVPGGTSGASSDHPGG